MIHIISRVCHLEIYRVGLALQGDGIKSIRIACRSQIFIRQKYTGASQTFAAGFIRDIAVNGEFLCPD